MSPAEKSATASAMANAFSFPLEKLLELAEKAYPVIEGLWQSIVNKNIPAIFANVRDLIPIIREAINLFRGREAMAVEMLVQATAEQAVSSGKVVEWDINQIVKIILSILQIIAPFL